jgi:hypothetical protein
MLPISSTSGAMSPQAAAEEVCGQVDLAEIGLR